MSRLLDWLERRFLAITILITLVLFTFSVHSIMDNKGTSLKSIENAVIASQRANYIHIEGLAYGQDDLAAKLDSIAVKLDVLQASVNSDARQRLIAAGKVTPGK